MYGFQQQLRFNSKLEFNNPVGMRWFNDKVLEKLISFSRHIKTKNVVFNSQSFEELHIPQGENTLVYLDPPYLLTTGSYNDGKRGFKGWNHREEIKLFSFMENLDQNGNRIMFSYVVKHGGKVNQDLLDWLKTHKNFNLFELDGIKGRKRNEILITNYDI
jgi:adenine-specific DNA-methyltransferase